MEKSDYVAAGGLVVWFVGLLDSYTFGSDFAVPLVAVGIFVFAMGLGMRIRGL
jgi:hypothetical protein